MTTYYHGGRPGLRPGDLLLPPSETGVKAAKDYVPAGDPLDISHVRTDRVFLTIHQAAATLYAATTEDGWIYAAMPMGRIEEDPDWHGPAGESIQVARAMVIAARPLTDQERSMAITAVMGRAGGGG